MGWLNYDKLYKFSVSLGLVLIALSFILYYGYAWLLYKETDTALNLRGPNYYKQEGFNQTYIKEIYKIHSQRLDAAASLSKTVILFNRVFLLGGLGFFFAGLLWWMYEEHFRHN